jgi:hypothetical protein
MKNPARQMNCQTRLWFVDHGPARATNTSRIIHYSRSERNKTASAFVVAGVLPPALRRSFPPQIHKLFLQLPTRTIQSRCHGSFRQLHRLRDFRV